MAKLFSIKTPAQFIPKIGRSRGRPCTFTEKLDQGTKELQQKRNYLKSIINLKDEENKKYYQKALSGSWLHILYLNKNISKKLFKLGLDYKHLRYLTHYSQNTFAHIRAVNYGPSVSSRPLACEELAFFEIQAKILHRRIFITLSNADFILGILSKLINEFNTDEIISLKHTYPNHNIIIALTHLESLWHEHGLFRQKVKELL